MQSIKIGANQAGQRLDKFLKKFLPAAGTSFLYKMLRKKNITLNGKKAEGKEMLGLGDEVCFFFADDTFAKFRGVATDTTSATSDRESFTEYQKAFCTLQGIQVLYEDENVLILNKPVGILTQKASPTDLSLNEWFIGYLLDKGAITDTELQSFHPSVCNRLDRNTSGIVLCGKSLFGSQLLSRIIKERSIRKFYHTICIGSLKKDQLLEGYLTKDNVNNKVTIHSTARKGEEGAYIRTFYHPLVATKDFTLLEVELITGKTHQIRAHLSSTGHPIIGDYKYGSAKTNNQLKTCFGLQAQLLHAYRIEFPMDDELPKTLKGLKIEAPYPQLFSKLHHELFEKV